MRLYNNIYDGVTMNQKEIQKIAVKIASQVIKVLYKELIRKKKPKLIKAAIGVGEDEKP